MVHSGHSGIKLSEKKISQSLIQIRESEAKNLNHGAKVASVLLPLFHTRKDWHLLFTVRTEKLQYHKGQVSFPGGAHEPQDDNLVDTALREAKEEICLHPSDVKILGKMERMLTVSNYIVTPIVGLIGWPLDLYPSPDEVQRIFSIPLYWLADAQNWETKPYARSNGEVEQVIFYKPFEGELLWGITATITLNFLSVIGLINETGQR